MTILDTFITDWGAIAAILIMISGALAIFFYMFGHFLSDEKMITYGKMGVTETFYSMILIVAVLWILAMATDAAGSLVAGLYPSGSEGSLVCGPAYNAQYGSLHCHMRAARYYLDTLYAEGADFNYEIFKSIMWYSLIQGIGISADFHDHASGSVQYSPLGSAFSMQLGVYSYMFEFGMKSMLIIRFQQFLLNFIDIALYPTLVCLGLLLRIFPITRRIGGLLLAIGISLFFIFPMFYVMGGVIFENIKAQNPGHPVIADIHFNSTEFYGYVINSSKHPEFSEDPAVMAAMNGQGKGTIPDDDKIYSGAYLSDLTNKLNYCQGLTPAANLGGTAHDGGALVYDLFNEFFYAFDFTTMVKGDNGFVDSLIGEGGVIDATARFVFFSMFFALLSIFSTVGAIRSLSPLFGGDIEIAGLTHLI